MVSSSAPSAVPLVKGVPGIFTASPQLWMYCTLSTGGLSPVSGSSLSSNIQGPQVSCPGLGVVLQLGGGSRSLTLQPRSWVRPGMAKRSFKGAEATSTNPQDLEHHLLVIPGFSGNLTSCFLHFTVTAKPGGQTVCATEEGGSTP